MRPCTILLLIALSGTAYAGYLDYAGCDILYMDEEPEMICGSDMRIYPNRREFKIARCLDKIDLLEFPLSMCLPQGSLENEISPEIGLRIFNLPERPQQKSWNHNIYQKNINNYKPNSYRQRENLLASRRPSARQIGHNLRDGLRDRVYSSKHGARAPASMYSYLQQHAGFPRTSRQFHDPLRSRSLPYRSPQYQHSISYDPYYTRPHYQPRFTQHLINPMPFHVNMPLAEQISNNEHMAPGEGSRPCNEDPLTEGSQPDMKMKTGRKVPDSQKSNPKGAKPDHKGKGQKPNKKTHKDNKGKNSNNGDNKKTTEGPEVLKQAVEERSSLKMLQNETTVDKKSESTNKNSDSKKAVNQNKLDKIKETSTAKTEKLSDSLDQKPEKDVEQDLEQNDPLEGKSNSEKLLDDGGSSAEIP